MTQQETVTLKRKEWETMKSLEPEVPARPFVLGIDSLMRKYGSVEGHGEHKLPSIKTKRKNRNWVILWIEGIYGESGIEKGTINAMTKIDGETKKLTYPMGIGENVSPNRLKQGMELIRVANNLYARANLQGKIG